MKKLLSLSLLFVGLQPNSAALITRARPSLVPPIFRACHNVPLSNTFALDKPVVYLSQPSLLSNKRYYQNNSTKSYKFFLCSAITFTLVDSDKKDQKPSFYRYMPKWTSKLITKLTGASSRQLVGLESDKTLKYLLKIFSPTKSEGYADSRKAIYDVANGLERDKMLKYVLKDFSPNRLRRYYDFMEAIGDELKERGMYEEADIAYENAEDIISAIPPLFTPDITKVMELKKNRIDIAFIRGNYAKVKAFYQSFSHELYKQVVTSNGDFQRKNELARIYEQCGNASLALGEYGQAKIHYAEALLYYKELHGKNMDWCRTMQNTAILDACEKKFLEARCISRGILKKIKANEMEPTPAILNNHELLEQLATQGDEVDVQFYLGGIASNPSLWSHHHLE